MFVKEFLTDHPRGNADAVNEAWQAAGFAGTISSALVNQLRAKLGLTRNPRDKIKTSKRSATGKKPGRPRKETTAQVNGKPAEQPRGRTSDRTDALLSVEAEIDKLIFQVMLIDYLPEVETALRQARRGVYGALMS